MSEIIAGKNPVLEALKAGRPLNKILLAKNIRNDPAVNEILSRARDQGIPVEFLERQAIDRLSLPSVLPKEGLRQVNTFGKLSASQGVLAYSASKDYVTLDDLLAIPEKTGEAA